MGIYSAGIVYYTGDEILLFDQNHGLPGTSVNGLEQDELGFMWVGSQQGLAVSTKPTDAAFWGESFGFRTKVGDVTLPGENIIKGPIHIESDGLIYVLTSDALFAYRWSENETLQEFKNPLPIFNPTNMYVGRSSVWFRGDLVSLADIPPVIIESSKLSEPLPTGGC